MNDMWDAICEIITQEQADEITRRLSGSRVYIPAISDKISIIYAIKTDLKNMKYKDICKKYKVSTLTVRRYEKWKVKEGKLISPNGKEYAIKGGNGNGNT